MTTSRPGRRTAALVSGIGLAAGSLLVAATGPAAAAPENDSEAVLAGADWLVGELDGAGLLANAQFGGPSYGLTIDAALSLAEVGTGAYDAQLEETTASLSTAEAVDAYTRFDYPFNGERFAGTSAGATGKLLSFAVSRGLDPTDVGGTDLRQQAEDLVTASGRMADGDDTGNNEDFANVIGQTWAARGLTEAGSASADEVTGFLLTQQCGAGFFPETFGSGPDGACDADGDVASVDTTALAVLNLAATQPVAGSEVASAIDDAAAWLEDQQAADGSIGGDNTNSTGLSAWALATVGAEAAAEDAAARVAGVQVAGFAACEGVLAQDETGGIALGTTQFERDTATGIDVPAKRDQWRVATAQALPALRSLPAATGSAELASPGRYVRAGAPTSLRVAGLAAGQKDCLTGPSTRRSVVGPGDVRVDVPRGGAARTYSLSGADGSVTVQPLVAQRLAVRLAAQRAARGARQTVTVRELAPRERVTVRFRGRVVGTGAATTNGFYRTSFGVTGRPGSAPVRVLGQFADTRAANRSFTVTR